MTRGSRAGHRCPVRVVIELSGAGQWSGTVNAAPLAGGETPFAGRLELLRLLEALVDQPHDGVEDGDDESGSTDEMDHDEHTDGAEHGPSMPAVALAARRWCSRRCGDDDGR